MEIELKYKPLSVNKAWKGKRFKTEEYKNYERDLMFILKSGKVYDKRKLEVKLDFGFSNDGSDIDNPIKPLLDILQKKYNFNDKYIYRLNIDKHDVKKGDEFINISINYLEK